MKNILLILVGGTICTTVNEYGTLSVSEGAGVALKENFLKSSTAFVNEANIVLSENLFILSENMTVDKWNLMLETYKKELGKAKYDGVIFAHGTDTLAYSAALFSMLLAKGGIPVFFVSSNARLDLSRANGNENFRCAVECICQGIAPDVYVAYKNISDGRMCIHRGAEIQQCPNYSEDFFSLGAVDVTDMTEKEFFEFNERFKAEYPRENVSVLLDVNTDISLKNCVLMLQPYVGMDYSVIDYSKFSAVLHGTYHSGTACAEKTEDCNAYSASSVLYMLDRCRECNVDGYISPSKKEGEVYDTVRIIGSHNDNQINYLYGTTQETAYAKLLIAYSSFNDKEKIKEYINSEINFEFIK